MPMDEDEKKELVKKIMEQRKAMWGGKPISDQPQTQPSIKPEESTTKSVREEPILLKSNDTLDDAIPVDFEIPEKKRLWGKITDEFGKSGELGWKVFLIMVALVGAIMIGVLIGYLMSTTGLMSKLKL
jgi:hypothetical protein